MFSGYLEKGGTLRSGLDALREEHRFLRILLTLLLVPFAIDAFSRSGWMTEHLGEFVEQSWDFLCLVIAAIGFGIRLHIAGHGQTPGASVMPPYELHTTGFFSVLRHPVPFANFLILIAGSLLFKSLYFTLLVAAAGIFYFVRLALAKEQAMRERFGAEFKAWASRTPMLIPNFSLWISPPGPFNRREAVRHEAIPFATAALLFSSIEMAEGLTLDGMPFGVWVVREPLWIILFVAGATIFFQQRSWLYASAVVLLVLAVIASTQAEKFAYTREEQIERGLNALASGGHVLLLRHARTEGKDSDKVDVTDCSTQRNLSDDGRDQAQKIGRRWTHWGIKFSRAISSQYCRTRETAQLAGIGSFEVMRDLNEQPLHVTLLERVIGNLEKDEKIVRPIRYIIRDWKDKDNLLLVSHAPVITTLTHDRLSMGEGLVLKPAPHLYNGFKIVGRFWR